MMGKVIASMVLAAACCGASPNTGAEGRHLFVLAGQSNMARFNEKQTFVPAIESRFGKQHVIVVKDAQGGKPIRCWYKAWQAPDRGRKKQEIGGLYERLMAKVRKSIQDQDIQTVTLLWMQGEQDAREPAANLYRPALEGLLRQFETDLGRQDINFVVGRLSDFGIGNKDWPHWELIRKAQQEVAEASAHIAWVNTDDLNDGPGKKGEASKDALHYTREGYRIFGERLADSAIALIRGQTRKPGPETSSSGVSLQRGAVPEQQSPVLETNQSLGDTPAGAAEVLSGTFSSALLGKKVPCRLFAPAKPEIGKGGMPIAIYTLNLECTEARPSSATDREIIADLIRRQFLVVAVDFTGGKVTDHLLWAKDTHGLLHVFGGKWHAEQPHYTEHRRALIDIPGRHAGTEMESVPSPDPSVGATLPINNARMYLLPPGYTVECHHVFNPDSGLDRRPELFFDIVYPMSSRKNRRIPVLLAQSATNAGDAVVNANSFVLYSWLFNGYALAITKNVPPEEDNLHIYPIVQAIRYLRWKAGEFSLNGIVSTAGISKAARRAFRESHFNGQKSVMDDGALPFSKESSKVSISMPAVGAGSLLDSPGYPDYPIWENLNGNSPAVVLGYHHLNPKDVAKHQGRKEKLVRDAYLAKGWEDRMLYLDVPLGAHEYNIYDLNKIMTFWDKFCKPDQR